MSSSSVQRSVGDVSYFYWNIISATDVCQHFVSLGFKLCSAGYEIISTEALHRVRVFFHICFP